MFFAVQILSREADSCGIMLEWIYVFQWLGHFGKRQENKHQGKS